MIEVEDYPDDTTLVGRSLSDLVSVSASVRALTKLPDYPSGENVTLYLNLVISFNAGSGVEHRIVAISPYFGGPTIQESDQFSDIEYNLSNVGWYIITVGSDSNYGFPDQTGSAGSGEPLTSFGHFDIASLSEISTDGGMPYLTDVGPIIFVTGDSSTTSHAQVEYEWIELEFVDATYRYQFV